MVTVRAWVNLALWEERCRIGSNRIAQFAVVVGPWEVHLECVR